MKQGQASVTNSAAVKREPIVHRVSETAVAQLGRALGEPGRQLYEGRGVEAPKAGLTIHPRGSQRS